VTAATRTRRRRPRPFGVRAMRDEAGAVAIIVALSVSTFLLGFAALAVDLGSAYANEAILRHTADAAALAGARELPAIGTTTNGALGAALDSMCQTGNKAGGWDSSVCTGSQAWATDGDATNGEITFYTGDPDRTTGEFPSTQQVASGAATGIRVALPPAEVAFGLGSIFGSNSVNIAKAATARIGTPLGMGVLPFAVLQSDLQSSTGYQFCVIDRTAIAGPGPGTGYPGPSPIGWRLVPPTITRITPARMQWDATNRQVDLSVSTRRGQGVPTGSNLQVYFGTTSDVATVVSVSGNGNNYTITVDAPAHGPGVVDVWYEVDEGGRHWVSQKALFTFDPLGGPGGDCPEVAAERGMLDVARTDVTGSGMAVQNVKKGLQPYLHSWLEWPDLGVPRLLSPLDEPCTFLDPLTTFLSSTSPFSFDVNCVSSQTSGFAAALTSGMLDTGSDPGRLLQTCGSPTFSDHGHSGIDNTKLLTGSSSPLLDPSVPGVPGTGTPGDLKTAVESGATPVSGWITSAAFKCPRLAMLPVIQPTAVIGGIAYPITSFTYAWIDDGTAGLVWAGSSGTLAGLRFHVIDPGYFPDVVAGSPQVGSWLGADYPKEALLVQDPSDPAR